MNIPRFFATGFTIVILFVAACKKDQYQEGGIPSITTAPITDILSASAKSGGTITSDGGSTIGYAGLCWSKTNSTPTIEDDTTHINNPNSTFVSNLKNLNSVSTYYVRAYAVNRFGIAYGDVITFTSGNAAPVATALSITGNPNVNNTLTGNYTYSDSEGDIESGSSFQWYVADDAAGAGEMIIAGATNQTMVIQSSMQGKFIRFGVTPRSSTGTQLGIEVKSGLIGAVGEPTSITFTYDGNSVTYGILISPITGRKWLDRNLGATRLAQSVNDHLAYGDLFQWGRLADGHQRISRTGPLAANMTGVTGTTSPVAPYEPSISDVPTTNKFIIPPNPSTVPGATGDWRTPQNNSLWQGVNGINNPCPSGWRVATKSEWIAEAITNGATAFANLKLTYTARRDITATFLNDVFGWYWSSTPDILPGVGDGSVYLRFNASTGTTATNSRGQAYALRCIKD